MRVLVIGAGVSGLGAARLATAQGHQVVLYDRDESTLEDLGLEGWETHGGAWRVALLDDVDFVVVSPGVPEHAEPIVDALSSRVAVFGELEYASHHLTAPIVAVTGTNGKTTVTRLIAQMLERSELKAMAAGNIGTALADLVGRVLDVIVVEASSFQLRFIESFEPSVAVLLNIAPDHLDWHGTFEAYRAAKANLIKNASGSVPLIFDSDDHHAVTISEQAGTVPVPVSGVKRPPGGWGVDGDRFVLDGLDMPLEAVPVQDAAFRLDLAAAGVAALTAGATTEAVQSVIEGFEPAPHRRTVVGSWDGITWVDDSKATNPHAAVAALDAYSSVVLIAGGRNKGLDLNPVITHPHVRFVVAIGEAAAEICQTLAPQEVPVARTMGRAVELAKRVARPGDTVLLAPGCASFDMFDSYGHRGDVFRQEVLRREEGE